MAPNDKRICRYESSAKTMRMNRGDDCKRYKWLDWIRLFSVSHTVEEKLTLCLEFDSQMKYYLPRRQLKRDMSASHSRSDAFTRRKLYKRTHTHENVVVFIYPNRCECETRARFVRSTFAGYSSFSLWPNLLIRTHTCVACTKRYTWQQQQQQRSQYPTLLLNGYSQHIRNERVGVCARSFLINMTQVVFIPNLAAILYVIHVQCCYSLSYLTLLAPFPWFD